ncbi:transcription antitermination factor NusB [uncultured Flavobacterium sp.]|uniref:transcription antitermination factor NusB n=1 Tax=uncultured Flavobacterium sp. TaxID=165435 RepID=UPI0030C878AC
MLNRRHIRVKVMQSIYAVHQHKSSDLNREEKFLFYSIEAIQDLYLLIFSALIELRIKEENYLNLASKKHLATLEEKTPNRKFVQNEVLTLLENQSTLSVALETKKINHWKLNDDLILQLLEDIKKSDVYIIYMSSKTSTFEEDSKFVVDLFMKVLAPNERLYDYLEDNKLTWIDDYALVNTFISKQLKQLKNPSSTIEIPKVYKDEDDKIFAKQLFIKTLLNESELAKEYVNKTPNWDSERIAEIDTILLKMAICELLKFPSIPVKVTINEYLEIAKEYSTPKSSIFINGILDNLIKDYKEENKLNKSGRGLM